MGRHQRDRGDEGVEQSWDEDWDEIVERSPAPPREWERERGDEEAREERRERGDEGRQREE